MVMLSKLTGLALLAFAMVSQTAAQPMERRGVQLMDEDIDDDAPTVQSNVAFRHRRHRRHGGHGHGHGSCGGTVGKAGDFDFYVFQQSWSAEFCSGRNFPGCKNPTAFMQTNMTIHGLWPQYAQERDGHGWPQCCQSQYGATLNKTVEHDNLKALDKYWPVEQGGDHLWQHEWGKHGTCSGMSPGKYLQSAIAVDRRVGTCPLVQKNIGGSVKTADLIAWYNNLAKATGALGSQAELAAADGSSYVALSCHKGFLSDVTTCYNTKLEQMVCPASLRRSCNDDTVKIATFKGN
jgi:ribonuclease T2